MITDKERREVANKLRERTKHKLAKGESMQHMFSETLGVYRTYDYGEFGLVKESETWKNIVNLLADLIDRPTCRLELTDVETYGNIKVRIYECSECGRTCEEIYGKYERCPHCGAVVVDAD